MNSRGKIFEAFDRYTSVVITGGSSGIGGAFIELCDNLCPTCLICNLSRSEPKDFCVNVSSRRHFACDIANRQSLRETVPEVIRTIDEHSPDGAVLLINNSGFGSIGSFPSPSLERQLEMIDLNVVAAVELTSRLLPTLLRRGGAIINIASTAAFQPTPYLATYGATKAFVLHWTLALHQELRGSGVHAIAICPGPTATRFFQVAGIDEPISGWPSQHPSVVARNALVALARNKSLLVSGWQNKTLAYVSGALPRNWTAWLGRIFLRRARLNRARKYE